MSIGGMEEGLLSVHSLRDSTARLVSAGDVLAAYRVSILFWGKLFRRYQGPETNLRYSTMRRGLHFCMLTDPTMSALRLPVWMSRLTKKTSSPSIIDSSKCVSYETSLSNSQDVYNQACTWPCFLFLQT
jgi:hypothetical protein